ncbi:MAG: hypothetical protein Q9225_006873 [Loekoesia sp. 1 TL-2023]
MTYLNHGITKVVELHRVLESYPETARVTKAPTSTPQPTSTTPSSFNYVEPSWTTYQTSLLLGLIFMLFPLVLLIAFQFFNHRRPASASSSPVAPVPTPASPAAPVGHPSNGNPLGNIDPGNSTPSQAPSNGRNGSSNGGNSGSIAIHGAPQLPPSAPVNPSSGPGNGNGSGSTPNIGSPQHPSPASSANNLRPTLLGRFRYVVTPSDKDGMIILVVALLVITAAISVSYEAIRFTLYFILRTTLEFLSTKWGIAAWIVNAVWYLDHNLEYILDNKRQLFLRLSRWAQFLTDCKEVILYFVIEPLISWTWEKAQKHWPSVQWFLLSWLAPKIGMVLELRWKAIVRSVHELFMAGFRAYQYHQHLHARLENAEKGEARYQTEAEKDKEHQSNLQARIKTQRLENVRLSKQVELLEARANTPFPSRMDLRRRHEAEVQDYVEQTAKKIAQVNAQYEADLKKAEMDHLEKRKREVARIDNSMRSRQVDLETTIQDQNILIQSLQTEKAQINSERNGYRAERDELKPFKADYHTLHSQWEGAETKLQELTKKFDHDQARKNTEIETLKKELSNAKKAIADKRAESEGLQGQMTVLSEKNEKLSAECEKNITPVIQRPRHSSGVQKPPPRRPLKLRMQPKPSGTDTVPDPNAMDVNEDTGIADAEVGREPDTTPMEGVEGGQVNDEKQAATQERRAAAKREFDKAFPHGYVVRHGVSNPSTCGFEALQFSMEHQHPGLEARSKDLARLYEAPANRAWIDATNQDTVYPEILGTRQLEQILQLWSDSLGKRIRLGVVVWFTDENEPRIRLRPHPDSGHPELKTVWIYRSRATVRECGPPEAGFWKGIKARQATGGDFGSKPGPSGSNQGDAGRGTGGPKPPSGQPSSGANKPSENDKPSGTQDPTGKKEQSHEERFKAVFPHGHEIIQTESSGLQCGYYAVIATIKAMHADITPPTVEELMVSFNSEDCQTNLKRGLVEGEELNTNFFGSDQVAVILSHWGAQRGLNIHLGYIKKIPYLDEAKNGPRYEKPIVIETPEEEGYKTLDVWIEHNGMQGLTAHWSGLKPKSGDPSAAKSVFK